METGGDVADAVEAGDLLDEVHLPGQIVAPGGDLKAIRDLPDTQLGKKSGDAGIIKINAEERADTVTPQRHHARRGKRSGDGQFGGGGSTRDLQDQCGGARRSGKSARGIHAALEAVTGIG